MRQKRQRIDSARSRFERFARNYPYAFATVVLVFAVAAVFGRAAWHGFISLQDPLSVTSNPFVSAASLTGLFGLWQNAAVGTYAPVTYSVWSAVAGFSSSGSAVGFHLANLIFHALSVWSVFNILATVLILLPAGARPPQRAAQPALWPAVGGALLFALHPLQVEAVAWVSGLKQVLSSFFSLFAVWQFLLFELRTEANLSGSTFDQVLGIPRLFRFKRAASHFRLALIASLLALLANPAAVAAPWIAGLIALGILRSRSGQRVWIRYGGLGLATVGWAFAVRARLTGAGHSVEPLTWKWSIVAADSVVFYLRKLVLPFDLSVDYGRSFAEAAGSGWALLAPAFLLVLFLLAWKKREYRGVLALFGIFVVSILPTLWFPAPSIVGDRFGYLALLSPALLLAWVFYRWPERESRARPIGIALLSLCAALSFAQVGRWRDEVALLEHAISVTPGNPHLHVSLGAALSVAGRSEKGIEHYERALRLGHPTPGLVHYNIGSARLVQNALDEAVEHLSSARQAEPKNPQVYLNLGVAYQKRGDKAKAMENYSRALALDGELIGAHFNLASLLIEDGKRSEAVVHLKRALEINPRFDQARSELQRVLAGLKK